MRSTVVFDANGFPLWLAIVGLLAAAVCLSRNDRKIHQFDKRATLPLRGLLAVFVILGHLKVPCSWASEWLPWVGWATPAVAVFFFLFGYGLCQGYAAKGDGYLSGFLGRSAGKILKPLVPVVVFYCLWLLWRGRFISLFLQFWRDGNTPVPNTWYVYALLLMYVFWWTSWRMFPKTVLRLLALWLGVLFYFCVMEFVLNWNYVWARTILAFPIGATFALYEKKIQDLIIRSPLRVYFSAVVLLCTAIALRAMFPQGIVALAGRGLTSTLGIYVILVWYAMPLPNFRVLNYLGGISYELYLVHGVWIALTWPLLKFGFWLYSLVVLLGAMLCAIALSKLKR